jgi:hypothetical protein
MAITLIMCAAFLSSPAQAAVKPCPHGVIDKVCECRAVVSGHHDICRPGQHCIRHVFSGACR